MNRLLAERVHRQTRAAEEEISRELRQLATGLKISALEVNLTGQGWVNVNFSGEDEEAFETVLGSTYGFAKGSRYDIRRGDHVKGFISERDSSERELRYDIGVTEPTRLMARTPIGVLRALLCDGRPVHIREIMDGFTLWDGIPVRLRTFEVSDPGVDCTLSDAQVGGYHEWRSLPLERLIIVGATNSNAVEALEEARLARDVAKVEPLSMFVQAVAAKIGTQARGLIRPLGRRLEDARFHLFDPTKARKLLIGQ